MHRRWVDNVTGQLAGGILAALSAAAVDLAELSTPERAACLWLAQMRRYRDAVACHERLRSLDCELFFDQPSPVLEAAMALAGAPLDAVGIRQIVDGELFRRHAKDPSRPFDSGRREAEMDALAGELGPEIHRARQLVEEIGGGTPVELPLASPLV